MSSSAEKAKRLMDKLFLKIEHGDVDHRNWLKDELDKFADVIQDALEKEHRIGAYEEQNGKNGKNDKEGL